MREYIEFIAKKSVFEKMLHEDQLFLYVGLKKPAFTDGVGVRG